MEWLKRVEKIDSVRGEKKKLEFALFSKEVASCENMESSSRNSCSPSVASVSLGGLWDLVRSPYSQNYLHGKTKAWASSAVLYFKNWFVKSPG